jgi:hypothetical protein
MATKLNKSIFGNCFYLVSGNFLNNFEMFSKYHEKFVLCGTEFSGEFSYKKTNIYNSDIKLQQIQSDIIIKNDSRRVWFCEQYVIKSHNNNITEKHNIKTIWHSSDNIPYICNTEYTDLPKELIMALNNIETKDILSGRFSK